MVWILPFLEREKNPTSQPMLSIFHFHPFHLHPISALLMQAKVAQAVPWDPGDPTFCQCRRTPEPSCPQGLTQGMEDLTAVYLLQRWIPCSLFFRVFN